VRQLDGMRIRCLKNRCQEKQGVWRSQFLSQGEAKTGSTPAGGNAERGSLSGGKRGGVPRGYWHRLKGALVDADRAR
jgi:hypothetical protein